MSFRAVTWAFDRVRGLTATQKLVLLALAEFANDDDETWRSRAVIAERAECSVSSVNQTLSVLREMGLVSVTGRYTWCDQDSGPCAVRAAHKHRSGTVYKLHLEVESTSRPRKMSGPADKSVASTLTNSASVEEMACSCGNLHTYKSCKCESTLANGSTPHLQRAASVLSINPQLNPHLTNLGTELSAGEVGGIEESSESAAAPSGAAPPAEDLDLVRRCLPERLRVLDADGLATVAALLRERVDAGWSPAHIFQVMDQPLPPRVDRLSSLVAYRLRRNVSPELAPSARSGGRSGPARAAVVVRPSDVAWDQWVWGPAYEKALNAAEGEELSPARIISATREVSRVLADEGLSPSLWRGYWAEAVSERPDLDPEDPEAQRVLTDLARGVAHRMSHASGN